MRIVNALLIAVVLAAFTAACDDCDFCKPPTTPTATTPPETTTPPAVSPSACDLTVLELFTATPLPALGTATKFVDGSASVIAALNGARNAQACRWRFVSNDNSCVVVRESRDANARSLPDGYIGNGDKEVYYIVTNNNGPQRTCTVRTEVVDANNRVIGESITSRIVQAGIPGR